MNRPATPSPTTEPSAAFPTAAGRSREKKAKANPLAAMFSAARGEYDADNAQDDVLGAAESSSETAAAPVSIPAISPEEMRESQKSDNPEMPTSDIPRTPNSRIPEIENASRPAFSTSELPDGPILAPDIEPARTLNGDGGTSDGEAAGRHENGFADGHSLTGLTRLAVAREAPRRGRPPSKDPKKTNLDMKQMTAYVPSVLHDEMKMELIRSNQGRRRRGQSDEDISDLVTRLIGLWVEGQKSERGER